MGIPASFFPFNVELVFAFVVPALVLSGYYLLRRVADEELVWWQAILHWVAVGASAAAVYSFLDRSYVASLLLGLPAAGWFAGPPLWHRRAHRTATRLLAERELEKWTRAIAADPHNSGAHLYLGHAQVRLGDPDAAASSYTRAIQLDPDNARDVRWLLASLPDRQAAPIRERLPNMK